MNNKKSFFEKLTGSISFKNSDDYDIIEHDNQEDDVLEEHKETTNHYDDSYDDEVGELSVDMYRTSDAIILKTMVAGIQKSEIDITLTRDQVRIEGSRADEYEDAIEERYYNELYWGSFERTVDLPEEIDIELAEAQESHGLLTLILPLVDRNRQARLKIK
jgi:HSP20 family protein